MKKLRVGIIGAGRIGNVHARTLATRIPQAVAGVVTDVNPQAARELADRCGIERVALNAPEILGDASIGAVLICSSTDTHAGLVVEAARAGKHIFCEKPIDHTLEKIDRALDAVAGGREATGGIQQALRCVFLGTGGLSLADRKGKGPSRTLMSAGREVADVDNVPMLLLFTPARS